MIVIELGLPSECLRLTPEPDSAHPAGYLKAELKLESLSATQLIVPHYASGFTDLAEFFASLAKDWRGWDGVRTWESLEGELRIEARHDGHVRLQVRLTPD